MFTNRGKALTFDDILLVPSYSEVTPDAVDISTWLTPSIELRIPLLSAAMDTVTESAMAISMARMGGIGIIHKNMPIERQRLEVERVKKSESGMILDPVTVSSRNSVQEALDLMAAPSACRACPWSRTRLWWASSPTVTCASSKTPPPSAWAK